jgi:hypothetical protein
MSGIHPLRATDRSFFVALDLHRRIKCFDRSGCVLIIGAMDLPYLVTLAIQVT